MSKVSTLVIIPAALDAARLVVEADEARLNAEALVRTATIGLQDAMNLVSARGVALRPYIVPPGRDTVESEGKYKASTLARAILEERGVKFDRYDVDRIKKSIEYGLAAIGATECLSAGTKTAQAAEAQKEDIAKAGDGKRGRGKTARNFGTNKPKTEAKPAEKPAEKPVVVSEASVLEHANQILVAMNEGRIPKQDVKPLLSVLGKIWRFYNPDPVTRGEALKKA